MTTPGSIQLPFEGKNVALTLPPDWRVLGVHAPRTTPALADLDAELRAALAEPIGCAPLAADALAGQRILIVVDDVSRPTPAHRYFHVILTWLRAHGARDEDLLLMPALGIHREMSEEEVAAKVGVGNLEGLRWQNHAPRDREAHVDLGVTRRGTPVLLNRALAEADQVVLVGAIEPHLLLGFGGGLKMLLPGLAHESTIAANHMQGASPERYNYVGADPDESPMRLDLEEAVGKLGKPIWLVNAVMNADLEVCRFVCGDPIAAHRAGVETARAINEVRLEARADVAIVASDPMNADLRQGIKGMGNVDAAVKEGGLIIGLLECRRGIGDLTLPPKALPNRWLRRILRLLGRRRVLWFIDKVKKSAGVEERFLAHFSMQAVRKNQLMVWSRALPADAGEKLGLFLQFSERDAMMEAARRYAPRRATVHVFPHGGVTYPVAEVGTLT